MERQVTGRTSRGAFSRAPAGHARPAGNLLFCKEKRLLVRRENPQLTFSELTKLLGAQWSAMSAKEKQMFFDKSSADKERYKRELEVYEANNSTSTASTTADGAARGLYCLSCDQYFNTSFNKEQHLLGKRHRLALIRTKRLSNKRLSTTHNTDQAPVDIETALFDFADKANEREVEIAFLIGAVEVATGRVFDLESKRQRLADTLSTMANQYQSQECVLYGSVLDNQKDYLIQRLKGLADPGTVEFHEQEMIFSLKTGNTTPDVTVVRLRRKWKQDRTSNISAWHFRYIGSPENDQKCPTIVRKTIDSLVDSNNMMEFIKALGL
uniref:Mediator of RNA polymerase II transcription subunit 18 n=1 Tax=Plectus sambesii TaxID=2011161 RepID=A0A914WRC8_9BILA